MGLDEVITLVLKILPIRPLKLSDMQKINWNKVGSET